MELHDVIRPKLLPALYSAVLRYGFDLKIAAPFLGIESYVPARTEEEGTKGATGHSRAIFTHKFLPELVSLYHF